MSSSAGLSASLQRKCKSHGRWLPDLFGKQNMITGLRVNKKAAVTVRRECDSLGTSAVRSMRLLILALPGAMLSLGSILRRSTPSVSREGGYITGHGAHSCTGGLVTQAAHGLGRPSPTSPWVSDPRGGHATHSHTHTHTQEGHVSPSPRDTDIPASDLSAPDRH